jgi:hypothetical protein
MSIKPYDGDFDALTGGIFASWFVLGPNGPAAYALGFAETTHRPWSLFYRGMRPTGTTTYLGAAVDQEIAAAEDFFDLFFNLLLGLNNYFVAFGGEEPLLSQIPAIVRTNGNPAVDAVLSWMIADPGGCRTTDWGRELYLRATCGAGGSANKRFSAAYERHARLRPPAAPEVQFARWWALVTDRSYVGPSTFQFARAWVEETHGPRSDPPRGRSARHGGPMSYSALATFFENFQMPLLPPEIDEQSLLESLGSR